MQWAINRVADWADSHGFRFSVEKSHAVLFRRTQRVFPEPSLTLYDCPLEVCFLGMIFVERLAWVPHLRSLRLACQGPLDLLRHFSHTTWGANRTTLLRLYLVLVRSKLDYDPHVYCTASPSTFRILDLVQNEGLRLATGAFRSSPITSLYVESNVLPLDLHRESLAVKALLRPYFLPSSPLRSLLASEDLASSSWKFALLVHPRLVDTGIVDLHIVEFQFAGALPRTFPPVRICLFLSKLPTFLPSYDPLLWSMHSSTLHLFPFILMGPNLVRVWVVPLFFLTLTYSSLFL